MAPRGLLTTVYGFAARANSLCSDTLASSRWSKLVNAGPCASTHGGSRELCLPPKPAIELDEEEEEEKCEGRSRFQGHERPKKGGLFGYKELTSANGFHKMADEAMERANFLIHELARVPPSIETIRSLDEISDVVCTTLDAAELCRSTHPDRGFVEAAKHVFVRLHAYVQDLNTSSHLYGILRAALESGDQGICGEAKRVAEMLRQDFERAGVHLSDGKRALVDELTTGITRLSMRFLQNIHTDECDVTIWPAGGLSAVPSGLRAFMRPVRRERGRGRWEEGYSVSPGGFATVLKWVDHAKSREVVYRGAGRPPGDNASILEELVRARHDVAKVLGWNSYSEHQVSPLLAKTPQTSFDFLDKLANDIRDKADQEMGILREYKKLYEGGREGEGEIRPWDVPFYTGLAKATAHSLDARVVASYFPLDRCVEGLRFLIKRVFQVDMCQVTPQEGEVWAPQVHKYTLTHATEGPLGVMYLDLLQRPHKFPNAAHFTLRCGRRLAPDSYQLPVVALVCSFSPGPEGKCLLSHGEVETLFHEFGHALHSLMSRTEYQHLSGTRAALDFVETPSHLLEYFASDPHVIAQFAGNDDISIPPSMLLSLRSAKKMFAARDLQTQVIYAISDLTLFGEQPLRGGISSVLSEIQNRYSPVKHVEGNRWETRFSHLINYGAGYYSYLYAKCFAAEIWNRYFAEDPLNPDAGEELRQKLFRFGGAKDPVECLQDVIPGAVLKKEGAEGIQPCSKALLKEIGV